ncbi:hypothetical protein NS226_16140 [Aureimonas ureilytica]|uniref:Uncharacterized protein n=1 Tax=Aureimonas ureilytica TaxID=401562 RepID=A0A175R516_9HYPH|nr:hypothetical protein [Aureimonas ureilytica]KTQ90492.1 hypothetical protein NS226_16140 [Aureimonas ureilytica]
MDLTPDEEQFLRAMRAITINERGEQVFVGLSADESVEFLRLTRRNESGEDLSHDPRFTSLRERHEEARQKIVDGKAPLDGPFHAR